MKLRLERKYLKESYTIGKLFIDGKPFCETLEWAVRAKNIPFKTAIPYGTYPIIIVQSPRFKTLVPLLQKVPKQKEIELHIGNTTADSVGCILVGQNTMPGRLTNSTNTFNNLMMELKGQKDITIEIV